MELIVRTAHGTADVSIDVHDRDMSLRDVIAVVTGQAAPDTASVDGRPVLASNTLASCGVVTGSVIDTVLDVGTQADWSALVTLRQLTGPGAGRGVALSAGSYRLGAGRRQGGTDLRFDSVDVAEFRLDVSKSGVTVTRSPQETDVLAASTEAVPLRLDGVDLGAESAAWGSELLVADGRMFRLEPLTTPAGPRGDRAQESDVAAAVDGFVTHNRPPGVGEVDRTIAEAVDAARSRSSTLWHRRAVERSVSVDVGLLAESGTSTPVPVSLDLRGERIVAVTGDVEDRSAMARSVLIDLCTNYGPADLDVVIASTPGELGEWDWAKWLPHLRHGDSVDLLTNDLEMAVFATRPFPRRTVVVVTADRLWNTASSPLRSLVVDATPDTPNASVLVLTSDRSHAPADTGTLVELDSERPGRARCIRLDRPDSDTELLVPMIDIDLAADAARRLAPLVDPDRAVATGTPQHHIPLDDIAQVAAAEQRWGTALGSPRRPVEMAVGTVAGVAVGVDLGLDSGVAISGSTIGEAVDIATVLTLSLSSTWSPAEAALLVVDHRADQPAAALRDLPHHAGTFSDRDSAAVDRLLTRLRDDLTGEQPSARRLVIVVNGLAETELAAPGLVAGLTELADAAPGVHLVVATARPLATLHDELRALCAVQIAVDRYGGTRRATLHDRRRGLQTPFSPYDEPTAVDDAVTVRPFVFGRRPTALERRLERSGQGSIERRDSAVDRATAHLRELAERLGVERPRPLLPVPLPTHVIASDLWERHSGDGVPLGIIDADPTPDTDPPDTDPPHTDTVVADWWLPGADGSRLFVGSPRSGLRAALEVLVVGVADRFAVDDVNIVAIEHNERRRTAMARIPHITATASPDHDGAVESALRDVARSMHERANQPNFRRHDHPTILVLARDLDRLSDPAIATLTHLYAEGAEVGINVVAAAARPDRIDATIAAARQLVVGALSDPSEYPRVGVERSAAVERHVGRAQMFDRADTVDGVHRVDLVQFAVLDAPLDAALDALAAMLGDARIGDAR